MSKHEIQNYSVGIVGYGFVGKAMHHLFPGAVIFDKYNQPIDGWGNSPADPKTYKARVNSCEIVFICVPTDAKEDGSVDLSAIEDVTSWLKGPTVVIKSTVPAESCVRITQMFEGKCSSIVFNPEFLTEKNWKKDVENETRIILGHYPTTWSTYGAQRVARTYQKVYGQDVVYLYTSPEMAMLTKYTGNAFLATKVAFFNEIYDICQALHLSFDELREIVLHDKRIGRTHTLVTEQRGFGGYCLPKDLSGLIATAKSGGAMPEILRVVRDYNDMIRQRPTQYPLHSPKLARPSIDHEDVIPN